MVDWVAGLADASVAERDSGFTLVRVPGSPDVLKEAPVSGFVTKDGSGNVGIGTSSITPIFGKTLQMGDGTTSSSISFIGTGAGTTGDGYIAATATEFVLNSRASTPLIFGTNDAERMRIDGSGNVLIGTTAATGKLVCAGTLSVLDSASVGYQISMSSANGLSTISAFQSGNQALAFNTALAGASTERMRINESGNVGIGTSSPLAKLHVTSSFAISDSGGIQYFLIGNRDSIGASGPSMIVSANRVLQFGLGNSWAAGANGGTFSPSVTISEAGNILAGADNTQTLGGASKRWSVVYAGTGTINTSDERQKTDIGEIPDAWLDAWAGVEWRRFKMIDRIRWHTGLVAQQVHAAFAAHDIDAFDIGLCCFDAWEEVREPIFETVTKTRTATRTEQEPAGEDENGEALFRLIEVEFDEEYTETVDTGETRVTQEAGDRWGLRYDECQSIEAAYQRRELARMAARLAALEAAT
jgi:hypothetical protein